MFSIYPLKACVYDISVLKINWSVESRYVPGITSNVDFDEDLLVVLQKTIPLLLNKKYGIFNPFFLISFHHNFYLIQWIFFWSEHSNLLTPLLITIQKIKLWLIYVLNFLRKAFVSFFPKSENTGPETGYLNKGFI